MIKMVVEVWKKPGMTDEQFRERWLVQHGDLVRKHGRAMGFVRYVQSHKLPSPEIEEFARGRGWKPAPDGITEVWWENKESMEAAMATPEGQAASLLFEQDEKEFTDGPRLSAFLAVEETIFDYVPAG